MSYLDKKGNYYAGDKQPGSVDAQERPTVDSVLIDDPLSDPMNCWRDKTTAELDAEKTAVANELDSPKKAFAAILELLWENSVELQTAFPNPGGKGKVKQEAVKRYKAKL